MPDALVVDDAAVTVAVTMPAVQACITAVIMIEVSIGYPNPHNTKGGGPPPPHPPPPQLEKDLAVKRSSLARTPTTIPLPPSISTIQKIDNKLDPLVSVTCLIGLQIKPGRDIDSVIKDK